MLALSFAALLVIADTGQPPAAASSVAGAGTYEETSPAIQYSGAWSSLGSGGSSGGAIRYATGAASASLTFRGSSITWYTWTSPSAGMVDVYLDGVFQQRVDNYSASTATRVRGFTAQNLGGGTHTIRIVSAGAANPRSSGRITHLDSFVVGQQRTPYSSIVQPPIRARDCPAATVRVSTSAELTKALADARPGTVIQLAPGTYTRGFQLTASGTSSRPIWICGPRSAVVQGVSPSSGTALRLDNASHVRVTGFTVTRALQGVMVKFGRDVTITDLHVRDTGYEAIHLYAFTTDSIVAANLVERSGAVDAAYGEGIYIGTSQRRWDAVTGGRPDRSDRNAVVMNTIRHAGAEAIEVKEGTSSGWIVGNTIVGRNSGSRADAWILVTGNDWLIRGNSGQNAGTHGYASHVWGEWGRRNSYEANTGHGTEGFGVWLQSVASGSSVGCDNWVTGTASGVTNTFCAP